MGGKTWILLMIAVSAGVSEAKRDCFGNELVNEISLDTMESRLDEVNKACDLPVLGVHNCILEKVAKLLAQCQDKDKDGALLGSFKINDLLEFTEPELSYSPIRCNRTHFMKYEKMCSKIKETNNRPLYIYCMKGNLRLRKSCVTRDRLYEALVRSKPFHQELLASSKRISLSLGKNKDRVDIFHSKVFVDGPYRISTPEESKRFVLQCCELVRTIEEELKYFDADGTTYKHVPEEEVLLRERCKDLWLHTLEFPIEGVSCHKKKEMKRSSYGATYFRPGDFIN